MPHSDVASRVRFWAGLLVIVVLGCGAEFATFARSDMAFLLHAAERVVDGARLYVDVVEINPPLIVAWNVPAVVVARAIGVSDISVLRLWDCLALFGSLAFSVWALRPALGPDRFGLRPIALLLAFALFLMPGNDFGQREHLLVALAMPYFLLAAARLEGRPTGTIPAVAAGALAAVGVALKPHFLLLGMAVEGYAAWRTRARRPSPEAVGGLVLLTAYAVAVAIITPAFFSMSLLLGPAYQRFGHYPFFTVLVTAPGTTESFLAVLTCVALYRQARHPALWQAALVSLLASLVAGALQLKGWTYHFLPARVFAFTLVGLSVIDVRRPHPRIVQRIYGAVALGVLGTSVAWAVGLGLLRVIHRDPVRQSEQAQLDQLVNAVRRHAPPGGSLTIFSYTIGSSFPLVNYSGLRWASRFPHLWIIEAAYNDELHGPPPLRYHSVEEMGPAERYLNDAVAEDLARYHPDVLMVLRHARDVPENSLRRLDYLAYFGRDARIARELEPYRLVEAVGQYDLYIRATNADEPGVPPGSQPGEQDVVRSRITGARALVADTAFLLHLGIFLVLTALWYAMERRWRQRGTDVAGQGAS